MVLKITKKWILFFLHFVTFDSVIRRITQTRKPELLVLLR